MRHDPAIASIVIMLRELKMHGMAQAVAELAEQGAPAFEAAQPILSQLLKAETAEREVRSVAYQLKVARFPAYRDLAGFDFSHSEVNEALVSFSEGDCTECQESAARPVGAIFCGSVPCAEQRQAMPLNRRCRMRRPCASLGHTTP